MKYPWEIDQLKTHVASCRLQTRGLVHGGKKNMSK